MWFADMQRATSAPINTCGRREHRESFRRLSTHSIPARSDRVAISGRIARSLKAPLRFLMQIGLSVCMKITPRNTSIRQTPIRTILVAKPGADIRWGRGAQPPLIGQVPHFLSHIP
jgi:hypothetical protein